MFLPFLPRDCNTDDFSCRDGEIDFIMKVSQEATQEAPQPPKGGVSDDSTPPSGGWGASWGASWGAWASLSPTGTYPTTTIRIPLQSGDAEKVALLLGGEASRVDASSADRLTQAMVQKSAEALLDITTDCRRRGEFFLPFRFYTILTDEEQQLSFPSPQAVALPTDFPPHPEITASSIANDTLTLALRFPTRPHRLVIEAPKHPKGGASTFISYPLYIPDPKVMRGSIGSVRSASGGNATGIRLGFLSISSIKVSVAAPEKYYEIVGNERTGYRISSKAAAAPDYTSYERLTGMPPVFPRTSMIAAGDDVDSDTDPLDWIADWGQRDGGYLPLYLSYHYRQAGSAGSVGANVWPDGIERDALIGMAREEGMDTLLLTRPMALCNESASRRRATPQGIRRIHIQGLGSSPAIAILYGSNDGHHWEAMRIFDGRLPTPVMAPQRLWWRIALLYCSEGGPKTVFSEGGVLNVAGGIFLLQ